MYSRAPIGEMVREMIRATAKAPVRLECERPYHITTQRLRVYVGRYARPMGLRVRVLTVDEGGNPLPPGELCLVRRDWQPTPDEDDVA